MYNVHIETLNTVFMLEVFMLWKQLKTSVSCRSACSHTVNPLMAQEASHSTELPLRKQQQNNKTNTNHQVCVLLIVRASPVFTHQVEDTGG